jgi:hypothetical protein
MKKLLFGTMLLALVIVVPVQTMAAIDIHIGIPLPPAIVIHGGPIEVVVIPETYVYVAPDIDVDLFFWDGWWWRPWEGRWYRSRYHDHGWVYYNYIPAFYYDIDPHWRGYYKGHNWHGNRWDYKRIPYGQVQQNWRGWRDKRYWENERKWDVEKYQRTHAQKQQELRKQRQYEYARRPDVQKHEQWKKEQQRQPQVQKPQGQQQRQPQQPQQQHSQPQGQQHQRESQHQQSQGKPEGGGEEHRK